MSAATTTRTLAQQFAAEALEQATDYGTRVWFREPRITDNAWGGSDITHGETTYRLTMDDGTVNLYVFTGGQAMLQSERATFSAGTAWLASTYIAEAMR